MENLLGLLRITVIKGINLAKRDARSSDPYVIIRMGKQVSCINSDSFDLSPCANLQGKNTDFLHCIVIDYDQKLKTRVVKKNVNPEWNEELTLSIADPNIPIKLQVYDRDTFSLDDKMGDAELSIKAFVEAIRMRLENVPCGTIITTIKPNRENCLGEESSVKWENGRVIQHMFLRLRNVESGEIELMLNWIDIPGSKNV